MINILKLRKLEKEKQQKSPEHELKEEDSVQINEAVPVFEDKSNIKEKSSSKPRKTKSAKKIAQAPITEGNVKTGSQIEQANTVEDNPVEIFRQNLLNELLNSDTLPEFSVTSFVPEMQPEVPQNTDSTIENIEHIANENSCSEVSGSTETAAVKEMGNHLKDVPKTEQLETVNSAIEKGKKNHDSLIHMVSFSLGKESYGVDIMRIREIIRMVDITKVPRAPEFIEGVINLRGSVIPVINLRTRIKLSWKEYDKATRIIVMELKQAVIGFIVDEVKEVLRISETVIAPPPLLTVGKKVDYITGVAKLENCLIILIEPERLLSSSELDKLK